MLCKAKIAIISTGYTHNCSGAISNQYILGNPYRNFFAGKGMYRITPTKATADFFLSLPLPITPAFYIADIIFYGNTGIRCN